jgi:hypothetical protein
VLKRPLRRKLPTRGVTVTDLQDERRIRAARNQATFREVNEQLENLASTFQFVSEKSVFICECADLACTEQVEMTMADYEGMRAHPNRFVVRPGHEVADVEEVVSRGEGFLLVSKIGAGEEVARGAYRRGSTPDATPSDS